MIELKVVNPLITTLNKLPQYATPGSAAVDLIACINQPILLDPLASVIIGSGIAIHIDNPNLVALLLPRSGLGAKHGIVLGNLTGVIDSDYRDEIKIALWNRGEHLDPYVVNPGDRIAQLMFVPVNQVQFKLVQEFTNTSERLGGLGHTGK